MQEHHTAFDFLEMRKFEAVIVDSQSEISRIIASAFASFPYSKKFGHICDNYRGEPEP